MELLYGWYSKTQYKNKFRDCDSPKKKGERIFYINDKDDEVEVTEIKRDNGPSLFKDAVFIGIVKKFSHVVRPNDIS
tara:strand:+ start:1880 stop:2110 length:231 start_codon:yes stop_codon:yes gene_type:complete